MALDKLPPQSLEAEKAVLGSLLISAEALVEVGEILVEDDFYSPAHRIIWRAIQTLQAEGEPVDALTLANYLSKNKQLEEVGGAAFITSLTNFVSTAVNARSYAQIVREKSLLREIIRVCTDISQDAYDQKEKAEEILDEATARIISVASKRYRPGFTEVADLVHPLLEHLEKMAHNKKDVTGVGTGYRQFDQMTRGLQPGDLIIIAGRPSMGKTAFALNICEYVALQEQQAVAIFSLEMSKEALILRLCCSRARIDMHKASGGFLPQNGWSAITTAAEEFSGAKIYIDDTGDLNVMEMRARARRLSEELKNKKDTLGLIVVDYLQMMRGSSDAENRQQEIAQISRSLKILARDLNVPVVALSQLSRRVEEKGRERRRPQLSDLRESGALEQDADVVTFIHREEVYNQNDVTIKGKAELILAKQRNGPIGTINLTFIPEYTRFEEAEVASSEVD